MVREISDTQKPLQFRVHEITDVEIVAKLPDTQKLQHVYCPGGVLPNMGYIGMCGPKG